MCPSPDIPGINRGYIIPIGGAEDKSEQSTILQRYVELAGGSDASIVIIPTASQLEDTGSQYEQLFTRIGVAQVVSIPIDERADAHKSEYLDALNRATGIFITGGNQLRLSTIIGGTPVARAIRQQNANGVHVAGTSAGAAIIAEHMIAGGDSGPTPTEDQVQIAPGLGLTNQLIIDQHFRERDRLGRLMSALSYNPFLTGIGIDENTAAFINPDGCFEVIGSGAVTVVDPSELSYSSMASVKRGDPVSLFGIRLHILAQGTSFDLNKREPFVGD